MNTANLFNGISISFEREKLKVHGTVNYIVVIYCLTVIWNESQYIFFIYFEESDLEERMWVFIIVK